MYTYESENQPTFVKNLQAGLARKQFHFVTALEVSKLVFILHWNETEKFLKCFCKMELC